MNENDDELVGLFSSFRVDPLKDTEFLAWAKNVFRTFRHWINANDEFVDRKLNEIINGSTASSKELLKITRNVYDDTINNKNYPNYDLIKDFFVNFMNTEKIIENNNTIRKPRRRIVGNEYLPAQQIIDRQKEKRATNLAKVHQRNRERSDDIRSRQRYERSLERHLLEERAKQLETESEESNGNLEIERELDRAIMQGMLEELQEQQEEEVLEGLGNLKPFSRFSSKKKRKSKKSKNNKKSKNKK